MKVGRQRYKRRIGMKKNRENAWCRQDSQAIVMDGVVRKRKIVTTGNRVKIKELEDLG